jgi:starch phosphorylase
MASLTPRFSANRAVCEYTEQHYLPAASAYRRRAADKGAVGKSIADWEHALKEKWGTLRFGEVKVRTSAVQHIFEAEVFLNGLDPKAIRVELYANGTNGTGPIREDMTHVHQNSGADGDHVYVAQVPATRPVTDYTVRVILNCDGVTIPLEDSRILWQR